jgi:predicted nucleotidyltransferase
MKETFADVLVGTIKGLQNKVETMEKRERDQEATIRKLVKDVSSMQKGMDLVLEHLKPSE